MTSKHSKFHQFLVLLASFVGQMISEGIMLSFTVYYPTLAEYFHSTNAEISLIGSFAYGCWFVLGGPFAGHFVAKFGSTAVLVTSGLIGASSIFAGAFARRLWQVILAFGVFALCCGLSFIPAITVITNYYNRHKGLATTAATVGGAAGAVAYPMLVQYILTVQTWQYGFIITAGVMLQMVLCGMILNHNPGSSKRTNHVIEIQLDAIPLDETAIVQSGPPAVVVADRKTTVNLTLFAVHNLLWNFTVFGFLTIIPLFLNSKQFNVTEIATLISTFSVFVIAGRCASAFFCLWKNADRIFLYNFATMTSSLFVALFVCDDLLRFSSYCTLAACYGFCFGIETGFVPIVTIDIVGPKKDINKSLGLVIFATGAGGLVSPYASGWAVDFMGNFHAVFIVGSLANFLCCFLILHLHWPLKRRRASEV